MSLSLPFHLPTAHQPGTLGLVSTLSTGWEDCQLAASRLGLPLLSPQTLCGMTLTKSFPPHTQRHASTHSFPFNPDGHLLGGSGLCGLWHSNLPCWLCQERKVPTALCPGRFAGLCLQQAALRDVIMSPSGTKRRLAYCLPQRFPRPVFLSYDTRHSIHLAHSVTSMGLRGRETDTH